MAPLEQDRPVPRLGLLSRGLAAAVIATASLVLVGWAVDSARLKSVGAGWESMKANTAAALLIGGIAPGLVAAARQRAWARATVACAGAALLLVGGNGRDRIPLRRQGTLRPRSVHFNGIPLAKLLSALRPALHVLYMSGYTDGALSQHGVLGEGVILLEKPFTADNLARAVREALGGPAPRG